jgi:hypothetical protein
MLTRFWRYQSERFPLVRHGLLVLATTALALLYLRQPFTAGGLLAASFVGLGLFWQLRVLDEFKDWAEDSAHRPYRPVPRGLVTLRELALVAGLVAVGQLTLVLTLAAPAAWALALAWGFMALTAVEFGLHDWLATRPLATLLSHAPITGLVQVAALSVVWGSQQPWPLLALAWLAASATAGGLVLELGRKIRAPADEEAGVVTYSVAWGQRGASLAWLMATTVASAVVLLATLGRWQGGLLPALLALLALVSGLVGYHYALTEKRQYAKWFEPLSALWALAVFGLLAWAGTG